MSGWKIAEDANLVLHKHIRVDRMTELFRVLSEECNGYERRVILGYLQDVTRHSKERLPMGLLRKLGIESAGDRQCSRWKESAREVSEVG